MDSDLAQRVVGCLVQAWQAFRMYPARHPVIAQRTGDCHKQLTSLLLGKSPLRLGLMEGTLFIDEHLFTEARAAEMDVVRMLESLRIDGLEMVRGLTLEEVDAFFRLTAPRNLVGDILDETLTHQGVHHLRVIQLMEEVQKPRAVYDRALKAVDQIFRDIQGGRIPSTDEVRGISKSMVQCILKEPHALFALAQIKDYDNYTFNHSVNVGIISLTVGRACRLPSEQLQLLAFGGMVHDLGKLKVPVEIITKPGRLSPEEFRQIERHPETGAELISQDPSVPKEVVEMVRYHHLHYNRDGYPMHAGRNISPLVDMVTIADHYDAMTTLRSYQKPLSPREAVQKMRSLSGTRLHPEMVECFVQFLGEYPVGTLLRLDSGEIALVVGFGSEGTTCLRLRRLFATDGCRTDEEFIFELPKDEWGRIIAEADPSSRGIDVTEYFK